MEPICGEELPVMGQGGSQLMVFDCTLDPGHDGRHEAHDDNDVLLAWWEDGNVITLSVS